MTDISPQPEVTIPPSSSPTAPLAGTGNTRSAPASRRHDVNRCGAPTKAGGRCPATVAGPGILCPMHDPAQAEKMALARLQGGSKPRVQLGMPEGWRADFSDAPSIARTLEAIVDAGAKGKVPAAVVQAAASAARAATEAMVQQREVQLEQILAQVQQLQEQHATTRR
jgi:hypothetical protein